MLIGTFLIGISGGAAALAQGLHLFETVAAGEEVFVAHMVAPGLLIQGMSGETMILSTGLRLVAEQARHLEPDRHETNDGYLALVDLLATPAGLIAEA